MLGLLWEMIIGLVVGVVAKFLMPGKDPGGIWITMIIGIAGAIFKIYPSHAIGWYWWSPAGSRFHNVSRRSDPVAAHLPRNSRRNG